MSEVVEEKAADEFYPELVGMLVNFIDKYEEKLSINDPDCIEHFSSVANNALFHISKESGMQFLLEEAGWFAGNRDSNISKEFFQTLKYNLTELYWEQLEQCMPLQPENVAVSPANAIDGTISTFSTNLKVEDHPDLFNDNIATYSYLPNILLNSLLKDSRDRIPAEETTKSLRFEGVCMLADISGFTKLTGRCCEEGTSGLDALHDACSGYLGKFVQTVYTYKGDVISFAGDALIVIFPLDPNDYDPKGADAFKAIPSAEAVDETGKETSATIASVGGATEEERIKNILKARCCQRAVTCGKVLASFFTDELTAHVGISYGPMSIAKLGGFDNQWVYLMNGACIAEISSAVDDASSKQVCVTKTVFENLFTGLTPVGGGEGETKSYSVVTDGLGSSISIDATATEHGNFRINTFVPHKSPDAMTTVTASSSATSGSNIVQLVSRFQKYAAPEYYVGADDNVALKVAAKTTRFNDSVKLFVPKPVIDAISFSTLETTSELREVTTMFMKLDSYDTEANRDPLTLQKFCYMAQQVLAETGGFLRQFLIDDKGCVLIAMWGVPSFSFSNNSSRAVAASVLIHDGTHKLGHKCSIGITSGTVFVGNIGSLVRRDFVAMGADVNLAARFMGKSKGMIFIDEKTANNLPSEFRASMPMSEGLVLKGVKDLTYAHICDGDVNAHATVEFLNSVRNTGGAAAGGVVASTGQTALDTGALLSKTISEPIKNRIQKTQRRHQFIARGKGAKTTAGKGRLPSAASILDILPGHSDVKEHHKPHPVNFIVAEGMAGTGKTTTANFFRFYALKCHVNVASVACIASDTSTPLGVVRKLALNIIGDDDVRNPAVLEKLVEHMHWDVHYGQIELSTKAKIAVLKRILGLAKSTTARSDRGARHGFHNIDDEDDDKEDKEEAAAEANDKELNSPMQLEVRDKASSTPSRYSVKNVMSYFSTKIVPELTKVNSYSPGKVKSNANLNVQTETDEADTELPEHTDDEGIFFHLFYVLLNHSLYALVIDDAHNADASSWNVIYMLSHLLANSVIFISLRSLHAHVEHHDSEKKTFLQKIAEKKNSVIHSLDGVGSPTAAAAAAGGGVNSVVRRSSSSSTAVGASSPTPSSGPEPLNLPLGAVGSSQRRPIPTPNSTKGGLHDVNSPIANKDHFAWSKAHHVPDACIQLLKNPYCIHLALNPFTLEEVRNYMCKALNTKELPEELIQSVLQVSTGSPYWCKQIASFISERGRDLFVSTTEDSEIAASNFSLENSMKTGENTSNPIGRNSSPSQQTDSQVHTPRMKPKVNPLHVLIICRLESMTVEQQAVIKHASIIGEAFHAALLERILPQALKAHLIDTIAVLVNNCLLFSDDEEGDTYKFGNHLIHQIIYDLTPPSESSKLHKLIGDCIEDMHNKNMDDSQDVVVYYQLLVYHYHLSSSSRAKAFKYLVKACDECVYRRAYEDCIKFATRAKDLANSRTELKILQTVVQGGSDEAHHKKESRKIFSITSSQRVDNSERVLHEMEELLVSIEDKIEELNATRGEVVPDMQAAMAEAISGKSSKTSGSGKRRGSLGNDSNSDTPGSGSGGASDDGSGSSGPPQRPSRMSGKLSGKLSTGNLLASAAAGIASISMDGSHSRHTSIAVARQKSRELDWESEVKHHLISAEQQAEEEKAAYNIKNLCVVM